MNAMPIYAAGIVLQKDTLTCGKSPVSHHHYIRTKHASNFEDRLVQPYIVLSPPCLSFTR